MNITTCFVREEETYDKMILLKKFGLHNESGEELLSLLLSYGILNPVKKNPPGKFFKFSFVGIIVFDAVAIHSFPKYIKSTDDPDTDFTQILKVIRRYNRKKQVRCLTANENESVEFSLLAEAILLLDDYAEHGLYSNSIHKYIRNGDGEIIWDKTISDIEPFFYDSMPLYMEFYTRYSHNDEQSYIPRLHKHILMECSKFLENSGIASLFDVNLPYLDDDSSEYFGPDDYILQKLHSELDIQFDSRKQELLHALVRFIECKESNFAQSLHIYGTTAFEHVWEAVCAESLGNQLHTPLTELPLSVEQVSTYSSHDATLMEIIKKPVWHLSDIQPFAGAGTLKPDMVTFCKYNNELYFIIFDAKYYTFFTSAGKLPGIEDIDKQYLYHLAFKKFLNTCGICNIRNIFLLPTEGQEIEYKGYVEFTMLKELGLENIHIVLLPAQKIFSSYLHENDREDFNVIDYILANISASGSCQN